MTVFVPALTDTLKLIVAEFGGIGNVSRRSVIETRIHNFLATHPVADQLQAIEEWFADLSEEEREDVAHDTADGHTSVLLGHSPPFTLTVLGSFTEMLRDA